MTPLCTMCMHGVNVKNLWECRECGRKVCSHLCSFKEADRTATCHRCLSNKKGEKK
jgi:hypothetical protein